MNDLSCPACGSDNLTKRISLRSIQEPFGGKKEIENVNYVCNTCDFYGDILNENEKAIQECLGSLKEKAVKNILEDFSQSNYSFSGIERALEIPQRTLSKWKSSASKPTATGLALLKFLNLFPWLIEVAENKYEYSAAREIHLKDAFSQIINHMRINEGINLMPDVAVTVAMQVRAEFSLEPDNDKLEDDNQFCLLPSEHEICLNT